MEETKIISRLKSAWTICEELKNKDPELVKDAFDVGASQLNSLKSWSTDKVDKNPLIRTMSYMSSQFPYLAKNNDELRKFPQHLIAKQRINGELSTIDLKDSRQHSKIRVSRDSVKYWLENGEECSKEIEDSVRYLNSTSIRKAKAYIRTKFANVIPGSSYVQRVRVATEMPTIEFVGQVGDFFISLFEGESIGPVLSQSDKNILDKVATNIMNVNNDPDDVIQLIRKLSDRKVRYIKKSENINFTSLIEMRHAVESNLWEIVPTNFPIGERGELELLRKTCGFLIYTALKSEDNKADTLKELLQQTFLGNQSMATYISKSLPYSDNFILLCKAVLGMNIPRTEQFRAITFILTSKENLKVLPGGEEILKKLGFDITKEEIVKTVTVHVKSVESNKISYRPTIWRKKVPLLKRYYHVEFFDVSCEIVVIGDELESMSVFSRKENSVIRCIAGVIVFLGLWKAEVNNLSIKVEKLTEVPYVIYNYYTDSRNWPFKKRLNVKLYPNEIKFQKIDCYFEKIVFYDQESSSVDIHEYKVKVDNKTLEVSSEATEGYKVVFIRPMELIEWISRTNLRAETLPKEIVSFHPFLVNRMSPEQKIIKYILEVFLKYKNMSSTVEEVKLSDEICKEMKDFFTIDNDNIIDMENFVAYHKNDVMWYMTSRIKFSVFFILSLLSNFSPTSKRVKYSYGKSKKVIYKEDTGKITLRFNDFIVQLPDLRTGTLTCDDKNILSFKNHQLCNMESLTILKGAVYFDTPVLQYCGINFEHLQYKEIPVSDLNLYKGKHVVFNDICYEVSTSLNIETYKDMFEQITSRQIFIDSTLKMDLRSRIEDDEVDEFDWGLFEGDF